MSLIALLLWRPTGGIELRRYRKERREDTLVPMELQNPLGFCLFVSLAFSELPGIQELLRDHSPSKPIAGHEGMLRTVFCTSALSDA